MDPRGPGPRPVVLDQLEGQRLEGRAGLATQQPAPPIGRLAGQASESYHVRVRRRSDAPASVPRHRVADELQEPHQREECFARHFP